MEESGSEEEKESGNKIVTEAILEEPLPEDEENIYDDLKEVSLVQPTTPEAPANDTAPSVHPRQVELQQARQLLMEAKEAYQKVQQTENLPSPLLAKDRNLQHAKLKLKEASERVQRLKRTHEETVQLPDISAMKASLVIRVGTDGPQDDDDRVYFDPDDDDEVRSESSLDSDEEDPLIDESLKKSQTLQQNHLQLLKRKLELKKKTVALKSKKLKLDQQTLQQQQQQDVVVVPNKPNKEELLRRQEELKHTMDDAYWRQLMAKQQKLLSEQNQKVLDNSKAVAECRGVIQETRNKVAECELRERQAVARLEFVKAQISQQALQVLKARSALHAAGPPASLE